MQRPSLSRPRTRRSGARVLLLLALACMIAICLIGCTAASAAELPEFNLLGFNGGTDITAMNMATGEYSGSSVVDGENFEVKGTETGNESISTFTYIAEPSYVSTNTDFYEILPDGNIGGPGSFHDTNGTEESYTDELNEPSATVASSVAVMCSGANAAFTSYACAATVTGNGGVPTGNVTLSASGGSFPNSNQCVLSDGSCSVSYQMPASRPSAPIKITAVYSADATFRVSQGSSTICGSAGVSITGAAPESSDPEGIVPGDKITLTGTGFCPQMTVQFGQRKASTFVAANQISADGSSATFPVPRYATTGTLTVKSAGQTVTFAEPLTIDSFRDTTGFSFPNIASYKTTVPEFEAAFGAGNVAFVNGADPNDNLTPRAHEIFEHFSKTSFSSGLCFGWVLAALRLDAGELPLSSYDADASVPWDLSQTPELESLIATEFWKQFSSEFVSWGRGALGQTESISALKAALEPGLADTGERPDGVPLTMYFYAVSGDALISRGAHEVIAYETESQPPMFPGEPEQFTIYVTDPNVPFDSSESYSTGKPTSAMSRDPRSRYRSRATATTARAFTATPCSSRPARGRW